MFTISTIKTCYTEPTFYTGWRNSDDPCFKPLDPKLTNPINGEFFNDYNPLLSFENIQKIAPNFDKFKYPEWDGGTPYLIGDIVFETVNNKKCFFQAITDNTNKQPSANPTDWTERNFLSEWIEKTSKHAIQKYFHLLGNHKKLNTQTKTILDKYALLVGPGKLTDKVEKSNRFVGYWLSPQNSEHLKTIIHRLGMQSDLIETDLKIYLYHSSQVDPIDIFTITTTKPGSLEWFTLTDITLEYINEDKDAGGEWYMGYYEADLNGQAIKRNVDFLLCGPCVGKTDQQVEKFSQFMDVAPIIVSESDTIQPARTLWDISQTKVVDRTNNFGLNFEFSINCDWTRFLCEHKNIFEQGIAMSVVNEFLSHVANSTRDNGVGDKVKQMALFELKGDVGVEGKEKTLIKEIKATDFDMSDLKSPCAPCETKRGIRRKSV